MDHTEKRQIRAGAGDALAKAFEMIATPAIFGVGGWLVDGRLGTFPLVTLILVVVVFGYQVWSFCPRLRRQHGRGPRQQAGRLRRPRPRGFRAAMSTVQETVDVSGASGASPEAPEAPERAVAADMARRSVLFAVPLLVGGFIGWGWPGVLSVGLALALVLVNFGLGAAAIGWGARLGAAPLMAAALGGYVVRLGIVTAAVLPIRHHDWFGVAALRGELDRDALGPADS